MVATDGESAQIQRLLRHVVDREAHGHAGARRSRQRGTPPRVLEKREGTIAEACRGRRLEEMTIRFQFKPFCAERRADDRDSCGGGLDDLHARARSSPKRNDENRCVSEFTKWRIDLSDDGNAVRPRGGGETCGDALSN